VRQNAPAPTAAAARTCPRGDIDLVLCLGCGFVFNAAFDPDAIRYADDYENSQAHSTVFAEYLDSLVALLIERHALEGRTVLEVGCGKGEFLARLCRAARCRGIGFDPSYSEARHGPVGPAVRIVPDRFDRWDPRLEAALVCCRHVIEHLARPRELLETIRAGLDGTPTPVFFETPRLEWILRARAFWDVCYEHCSYFTTPVLARLFESCGFTVTDSGPAFGGQYQWLTARADGPRRPAGVAAPAGPAHRRETEAFGAAWAAARGDWEARMAALARRGPSAVWGAGAKGVMFLNLLDLGPDAVPVVVDQNPRKQGAYVPGTGQPIVPPAGLREHGIRTVLLMNPNYREEVAATLSREGLAAELVVLEARG
jgi:SAM-dependent methyltransferase